MFNGIKVVLVNMSRISVVIPAYQASATLEATIRSVLLRLTHPLR